MQIGLTCAPAAFQSLMKRTEEGLMLWRCAAYIGYILVHRRSVEAYEKQKVCIGENQEARLHL